MSTCSMEEWLEMQLMHHKNEVTRHLKMLVDYKNGDYWYKVDTIPAYADKGHNVITEVGKKGESKYDVADRCEKKFRLAYEDYRPHAIMMIKYMCFESGHMLELKERKPWEE